MSSKPDNDKLILEQAARWHLWLRDHRADPATMDVFQRWRSSNRKHRLAYERIEALWQQCDGIDPLDLPWPTELELSLDQYDGTYALSLPERRNPLLDDAGGVDTAAGHFVLGRKPVREAAAGRRWLPAWPLAASIGVVALLAGLLTPLVLDRLNGADPARYATEVAQQRVQALDDGSVITLGGDSRVSVNFDRRTRRVVLERGEAYFEVAADASRPFTVEVANGEVRAVGTAFNINKRDEAVTVSVVEGVVAVSRSGADTGGAVEPKNSARLERGQELVYDRTGTVWKARKAESLERAVAWRDGRLAFVNERLDRVVQDVNRYSKHKLVIGDKTLADRRFTGTIFSQDIESWLDGLEQAFAIRILNVDGRFVLLDQT